MLRAQEGRLKRMAQLPPTPPSASRDWCRGQGRRDQARRYTLVTRTIISQRGL